MILRRLCRYLLRRGAQCLVSFGESFGALVVFGDEDVDVY